jgi:hypothetical protein
MDVEFKYRGRVATGRDIEFIRRLIAENPEDSRRRLSQKLCRAWNWVQPNGTPCDMICRGFMLGLERAEHIKLPAKKRSPNNPFVNRTIPPEVDIDRRPIVTRLSDLQPLEIRQVRHTPYESVFNSLIAHEHYLGYCHPVGEQLKYMVFTQERPIACLAWSSSPRHIGCRDRFIGWSAEVRKKNLHLIAYNSRYVILPFVQVPHLASHILGRTAKVIARDWQRIYQHGIWFLSTFVDTERGFKGTCYHAANWTYMGDTKGLGKDARNKKQNRSMKAVWGYPLSKHFREVLQRG